MYHRTTMISELSELRGIWPQERHIPFKYSCSLNRIAGIEHSRLQVDTAGGRALEGSEAVFVVIA